MTPEIHRASKLLVHALPGTTEIVVTDGLAHLRLSFAGDPDLIATIDREVRDGTLRVMGPPLRSGPVTAVNSGGRNVTTVIGSITASQVNFGGGLFIAGNNYGTIDAGLVQAAAAGGMGVIDLTTTIEVPPGTAVTLETSPAGFYRIGDTKARLGLKVHGVAVVEAGHIGDGRIRVLDGGQVTIANVTADRLDITAQGTGPVTVTDGQVDELNVEFTGVGTVEYGGVAERAHLTHTGVGEIRVNKVTAYVSERATGVGRIYIHQQPPRTSDTFWNS